MQTDLACNYKPIPGMIKHNGDETEVEDKGKIMKMPGLWRILKDCKVVDGGDRVDNYLSVYNRIHALGKLRIAQKSQDDPAFDVYKCDPHDHKMEVVFADA